MSHFLFPLANDRMYPPSITSYSPHIVFYISYYITLYIILDALFGKGGSYSRTIFRQQTLHFTLTYRDTKCMAFFLIPEKMISKKKKKGKIKVYLERQLGSIFLFVC